MNRSVAVMRMHLVDRMTLMLLPAAVLASAFVINVLIWSVIARDGRHTGAVACLPIFLLVTGALAVVRGLPFALGMGSSRRAFTLGTAMTGVLLSVAFGTLAALLRAVERLTDGWGMGGNFFDFPWMHRDPWPVVWLLFVLTCLASWTVGSLVSACWARFGNLTLVIGVPALILVAGALAILVSWRGWWHDVWHWCAQQTPATTSPWLIVLTALAAAATWSVLRRVRA